MADTYINQVNNNNDVQMDAVRIIKPINQNQETNAYINIVWLNIVKTAVNLIADLSNVIENRLRQLKSIKAQLQAIKNLCDLIHKQEWYEELFKKFDEKFENLE